LRERLSHLRSERITGFNVDPQSTMTPDELAQAVKGEWIRAGLLRIEETSPVTDLPGNLPARCWTEAPLLPDEAAPPPAIYIDTETTGLSGGSGTVAFLVGLAEVAGNQIRLSQFLITSFAAETAMLEQILERLKPSHRLVSYNGKSYDIPLLATRLRMQGLSANLDQHPHLDLLHPIRRLFNKRWHDCRLTTVEQQLLHFSRQDDLPGSEAPAAWFAYLQRQQGVKLVRVVQHNRQDILSLAAIHRVIPQALDQPEAAGIDLHGLGRWLQEVDEPRALAMLAAHQTNLCDDGKRLLAYLYRRAERWDQALPIWEELASRNCVDAIERLAKYHEHISRDLNAALGYCKRLPGSRQDAHRRARIERKLACSAGPRELMDQMGGVDLLTDC
jgi:hypothetical protein